jgi:hypothetical protein
MGHYLDCKGTDLKTDKRIFVKSDIVQANMEELRKAVLESPPARLQSDEPFKSRTFNMADRSCIDSYAGLYYGHLEVEVVRVEDERLILKWRAECPWEWPSYEYMSREYGNPHHLIFPIPNVRYALAALLSSSGEARQYALWLDDGLGEHLTHIGLAKSFVLYSEWQEEINPNTEGDA